MDVGHNAQLERRYLAQRRRVLLDLLRRAKRIEIELLPDDQVKVLLTGRQPPNREFLGALCLANTASAKIRLMLAR